MQTDQYLASQSCRGKDWQQIARIKIAKSALTHEFMSALWSAGYKTQIELARDFGYATKGVEYDRTHVSRAATGDLPSLRQELFQFLENNPKK